MKTRDSIEQDRPSSSESRNRTEERKGATRLPARNGRRPSLRPPVDPDLERFLVSYESPDVDLSDTASDPKVEIFIPEEVPSQKEPAPLPQWKKLSDDGSIRKVAPPKESVQQLVHVPRAEPLFPDLYPQAATVSNDPDRLYRILFRRFPVFIFVAILVWSAVGVYLAIVPPTYESTATLMVDTKGFEDEIKDLPRLNTRGASLGSAKMANQTLFLQASTDLATRAATNLAMVKAESPDLFEWTIFDRQVAEAASGATLASLLLKEYVEVSGSAGDEGEPDAINITSTSSDGSEAALIANVYSQTYVEHVDALVREHFEEATTYYAQKRNTQQAKLDEITAELKAFIRRDGNLFGQEESSHVLNQISALMAQLDASRIKSEELNASILSLEEEMTLMDGQLVAERSAHGIEDQLDQSYERIAKLNIEIEQFYVKNPDLKDDPSPSKDLVDRLSERSSLQFQVDTKSQEYSDAITSVGGVDLRSYDGAISYMAQLRRGLSEKKVLISAERAKEKAILNRLREYEVRRRGMPEREVENRDLNNRYEFASTQLEDLDDKLRRVEEASNGRHTFVRVLNPAVESIDPKMDPRLILFLGGFLGLFAGIGAAMVSEKTDRRLYEKEDIEKHGVDVICAVPKIRNAERKSRKVFYERKVSAELVALLNPDAPATRSLHSIPLRFAGTTLKNSVFVFTGVDNKVGTSFLAANTATTLAKSGARVLLVDANINSPSIIKMFGLTEQAKFDLEVCSFASGKGIEAFSAHLPNLFALSVDLAGSSNPDMLLSNNLIPLIQQVRTQFDAIIVDTVPLSDSTTALGLSELADELILVVRSGSTDGRKMKEMADDITSTTGTPARAILNAFGSENINKSRRSA